MEGDAAEELDIEVDHVPSGWDAADGKLAAAEAASGVFYDSEGFGEDSVELALELVEVLDFGEFLFPSGGALAKGVVRFVLEGGFDFVDSADNGHEAADFARVFGADDFLDEPVEHGFGS